VITVDADISSSLEQTHCALVPSHKFSFSADLNESGELFRRDWEQKSYFDSYYFDRSLWHSVLPIVSVKRDGGGHRDVLLIDFVNQSKSN
jgi:hypothetical protein